jgi:hypothetical protein
MPIVSQKPQYDRETWQRQSEKRERKKSSGERLKFARHFSFFLSIFSFLSLRSHVMDRIPRHTAIHGQQKRAVKGSGHGAQRDSFPTY